MGNKLLRIEQIVAAIAGEIGGDFGAAARIAARLFPQGDVALVADSISVAKCAAGADHMHFFFHQGDICIATGSMDLRGALDFCDGINDELEAIIEARGAAAPAGRPC